MPLPLLAMAIGGGLGAAVGSYGYDNWGWSKNAIWMGGLAGAGAGYLAAPGAGAVAVGPGASAATTAVASSAPGITGAVAPAAAKTAVASKGLGAWMTTPLIKGAAFTNPLMLGAAGLSLASAFSSQGSAFQEKISLTKEGKELQKTYQSAAKTRMDKAKKGDVSDRAFQDISTAKTAEGIRFRETQGAINTIQATVGNVPKAKRGTMSVGGGFVKAQLADTGERMTGLFAPTSILNNYRKEELINATKEIQNLRNIDNQTAVFNYGSSLAKWGANQAMSREKGGAIGSTLAMFGNAQLNAAYMDQLKIAS